ncbi:MAG: ComF family protein [Oscillospiraceae bacterium]|nr:ComF family protein [Oscillospiraceae bacterium]
MIGALLNLLYPARCVFCGIRMDGGEVCVCGACRTSLPRAAEGRSLDIRAPWLYRGPVRKALHRFKFGGATMYARTFGAVMAQCVQAEDYDLVAWVPCGWRRRLKRRFDQSRLLALKVARALDRPLVSLLVRKRHGRAQFRAEHADERRRNVKDAFAVRPKSRKALPAGARVLLVDDICTTGATFSECRRVILEAGAGRVTLLAAARTRNEFDKTTP